MRSRALIPRASAAMFSGRRCRLSTPLQPASRPLPAHPIPTRVTTRPKTMTTDRARTKKTSLLLALTAAAAFGGFAATWVRETLQTPAMAAAAALFARPEPPLAAGPAAARSGATSMMDISDGLLRDATRTLMKATHLIRKHGLKHRMPQEPLEFLSEMNTLCM